MISLIVVFSVFRVIWRREYSVTLTVATTRGETTRKALWIDCSVPQTAAHSQSPLTRMTARSFPIWRTLPRIAELWPRLSRLPSSAESTSCGSLWCRGMGTDWSVSDSYSPAVILWHQWHSCHPGSHYMELHKAKIIFILPGLFQRGQFSQTSCFTPLTNNSWKKNMSGSWEDTYLEARMLSRHFDVVY